MPNVEAVREANGSGRNEETSTEKSEKDNRQTNVKTYNVGSLGHANDRHPWGCPVTHTREKFYTICSDYAFLNQATSLCKTSSSASSASSHEKPSFTNPLNYIDLPASASDGIYNEDTSLDSLSSDVGTYPLAWEIDTSDFNTMTTNLKPKTAAAMRCSSPKPSLLFTPWLSPSSSVHITACVTWTTLPIGWPALGVLLGFRRELKSTDGSWVDQHLGRHCSAGLAAPCTWTWQWSGAWTGNLGEYCWLHQVRKKKARQDGFEQHFSTIFSAVAPFKSM